MHNHHNTKFRKKTVLRAITLLLIFVAIVIGAVNLPNIFGANPPEVQATSTEVFVTKTVVVSATATATSTPIFVPPTKTPTPTATPTRESVHVGNYDTSIPYYIEVYGAPATTFIQWVSKTNVDPRLAFLTNGTVEEIIYTDDAPVYNINGEEYIQVYSKSNVINQEDLTDDINKRAIMYVRKSDIQPAFMPKTAAEMFLRRRILHESSSFYSLKMKGSEFYRVRVMAYVLPEIRFEQVCPDNDGMYGVADMLVYIPGKGLRKHGLAIYYLKDNIGSSLYGFGTGGFVFYDYKDKGIFKDGAEAVAFDTAFSFANTSFANTNPNDFTQSFNIQSWYNNQVDLGWSSYFTNSWDMEESMTAYKHINCFAKGYERFLESKGDQYTVFLSVEEVFTSGFESTPIVPITPEELKAIREAASLLK